MSLLDWDYDDLARQVQGGLDLLSVSFFRRHGARVRRDELDFHGYDHVEFELAHDGHRQRAAEWAGGQSVRAARRRRAPPRRARLAARRRVARDTQSLAAPRLAGRA